MIMLTLEECILELPELTYDKDKLVEVFEQVKGYARVKSLSWTPPSLNSIESARNVVIQSHDYMMLKEEEQGKGVNLLDFPYVRELVDRLDIEVNHTNLDIMWNRPGFRFLPHVDRWAASVFVWPILSDGEFNPVDFYNYDGEIVQDREYPQLTLKDIALTHNYSDTYATVFNSHLIHGVRMVKNNRIFMRLRTDTEFHVIREKYQNGALIKSYDHN
jgi:hypothetical protein